MELAFKSVNLKKIKTPAFRVHVIEIVLNAVYYNAALTISLLERASWTTQFIGYWFRYLSEFKRVHDKKLSILTICTILEMPRDQIPHSVQVIWKDLMGAALTIFATLPAAIEAREAQDDDQDDDDFKYREDYADEYEDEAEEDVTVESLAAHASQFSEVDDDDDEEIWGVADFMEEDICFMTALDPIDPYVRFQSTVTYLNSVDQGLFQSLSQDQRTVLQYCMTKAQSTS
jgi:hypothetical protein